jgi:hypothetical protein
VLACHFPGNLRRRLGCRAVARVCENGRLGRIARPDNDRAGAVLHLAGKVTPAASQSKPPGTRRIAQDDHDAPLFGHASDATPTPAKKPITISFDPAELLDF